MKQFTNHQLWLWHVDMEKCKWSDIYDNEQELIDDLLKLDFTNIKPTGYEYLMSFQKRLNEGKSLTDNQIIQLKRLAKNIAFELYSVDERGSW